MRKKWNFKITTATKNDPLCKETHKKTRNKNARRAKGKSSTIHFDVVSRVEGGKKLLHLHR